MNNLFYYDKRVKSKSNHNTRCYPIMNFSKRDKIKKVYFSKDWELSLKLSQMYIHDPSKTWDKYLDNIKYLEKNAILNKSTFEPCYNDRIFKCRLVGRSSMLICHI